MWRPSDASTSYYQDHWRPKIGLAAALLTSLLRTTARKLCDACASWFLELWRLRTNTARNLTPTQLIGRSRKGSSFTLQDSLIAFLPHNTQLNERVLPSIFVLSSANQL